MSGGPSPLSSSPSSLSASPKSLSPRTRQFSRLRARRALSSQAAPGTDPTTGEFLRLVTPSRPRYARPEGVAPPESHRLTREEILDDDGHSPRVAIIREHFYREGRLSKEAALLLLEQATQIWSREKNVLRLSAPITTIGDVHGQYYDLLHTLDAVDGDIPMLFLGDFVDRGYFGCEVFLFLCAQKLATPDKIHMLRGNHEAEAVTKMYNFHLECMHKYDMQVYEAFIRAFESLPLAALVTNDLAERFLCLHGGISPYITDLDDLDGEDRFGEVPTDGALTDILWSDPLYNHENEMDQEDFLEMRWDQNRKRKISYTYGWGVLEPFLDNNELQCIIRAHEVKQTGCEEYWFGMDSSSRKYAPVYTCFSAPNYVDVYGNLGGFLVIKAAGGLQKSTFSCVPHPYQLPGFDNAFSYGIPFMMDNLTKLMAGLLKVLKAVRPADEEAAKEAAARLDEQIRKLETWAKVSASVRERRHSMVEELRSLSESGSEDELFARAAEIDANVELMSPMMSEKLSAEVKKSRRMSSYF